MIKKNEKNKYSLDQSDGLQRIHYLLKSSNNLLTIYTYVLYSNVYFEKKSDQLFLNIFTDKWIEQKVDPKSDYKTSDI